MEVHHVLNSRKILHLKYDFTTIFKFDECNFELDGEQHFFKKELLEQIYID